MAALYDVDFCGQAPQVLPVVEVNSLPVTNVLHGGKGMKVAERFGLPPEPVVLSTGCRAGEMVPDAL
jgi:hypothetical protein